MRILHTYIAAAALATAGIGFTGCDREETTTTTRNDATPTDNRTADTTTGDAGERIEGAAERTGAAVGDAAETAGDKISDAASNVGDAVTAVADPTGDRVPGVIADVTDAALTKGGVDDMVERFVDADRNRIGKTDLDDLETLDGLVADLQKSWKAKYNNEFDIENLDAVYPASFLTVQVGELGRAAAGAEVDVDVDRELDGGAEAEIDVDRESGVDAPGSTAADRNLNDPGRNVALATIQGIQGQESLQVPFIHEALGWRIDVPDSVDGPKLRQNLLDHLTAANNMKDQWPATEEEAYRAMTHHVFMAIMDKPVQK